MDDSSPSAPLSSAKPTKVDLQLAALPLDVAAALKEHSIWLRCGQIRGKRLNLTRRSLSTSDLSQFDLSGSILTGVNLQNANLNGAKLLGADLRSANLQGANLQDARLETANLEDANLCGALLLNCNLNDADLRDSDLHTAKELSSHQLAGANLSGSKLPEPIAAFSGLQFVNELSKDTQKLLGGLLLACAYCWLTIASTKDPLLFTGLGTTELPIIRTTIPLWFVYTFAPLLLLCGYLYFHIYMQRLWEVVSTLPAIFPDGIGLRQRINPWMLNGFVFRHLKASQHGTSPALSLVQRPICILLAWGLVPLTNLWFWFRYLRRQEPLLSIWHSFLLGLSVVAALFLYELARDTLENRRVTTKVTFPGMTLGAAATGLVVFAAATVVYFAVWKTSPPSYIELNFEAADVSTRPGNWQDPSDTDFSADWRAYANGRKKVDLRKTAFAATEVQNASAPCGNSLGYSSLDPKFAQVKGARLSRLNLRKLRAAGSFLLNSDFEGSEMSGANLRGADLRRASLENSSLDGAKLEKAQLVYANLTHANLSGAYLKKADLRFVNCFQANLSKADLSNANLFHAVVAADLSGAKLDHADVCQAVFSYSFLQGAIFDNAIAEHADFSSAIGTGAKFESTDLSNADFTDADLKSADFAWSTLANTVFERAKLQGADLRGAVGLTEQQLIGAFLDNNTKCPDKLEEFCRAHAQKEQSKARSKGRLIGRARLYGKTAGRKSGF